MTSATQKGLRRFSVRSRSEVELASVPNKSTRTGTGASVSAAGAAVAGRTGSAQNWLRPTTASQRTPIQPPRAHSYGSHQCTSPHHAGESLYEDRRYLQSRYFAWTRCYDESGRPGAAGED